MNKQIKPSFWVPSLYFIQGLPFAVVTLLSEIIYKELGIINSTLVLFVSLFGLPWVLKPVWSPLLEIFATKKIWILCAQLIMTVLFIFLSAAFFSQYFFPLSLILFFLLAFCSATNDSATDGYYLLNLDSRAQAAYVGIRTLFFQLARFFCSGGIVMFVGHLEKSFAVKSAWQSGFLIIACVLLIFTCYHFYILPESEQKQQKHPTQDTAVSVFRIFPQVFQAFFALKNIIILVIFLLIYNAAESQLLRIVPLFLLDKPLHGGLGLSTTEVGLILGLIGTISLMFGAVLSGWIMQKYFCLKVLIPITAIFCLANCGYILLESLHATNIFVVAVIVTIAQFAFGLATSAYMAFLMNIFSLHKYCTSFYAIGTAIMACGVMFFGMLSGYMQLWLTYHGFFYWVALLGFGIYFFTIFVVKRTRSVLLTAGKSISL
ncbi:MAG: MFS transporter [Gammaproteobacteria bacterium]|nr:MFS transporter [Gammaproteobacteria bacterium]